MELPALIIWIDGVSNHLPVRRPYGSGLEELGVNQGPEIFTILIGDIDVGTLGRITHESEAVSVRCPVWIGAIVRRLLTTA
jgi:hypothetical protein